VQKRPSGQQVLEISGLKKSFDDLLVLNNLDLNVNRGDRIAVIGPNGVGKSTLIKILAGVLEADEGKIQWGFESDAGYFAQNHRDLIESNTTVFDWLYAYTSGEKVTSVRSILGQILFSADDIYKTTDILSGGEAARLIFAKLMVEQHNILLLDEPSNHLDLEAIESLEDALLAFPGTVIFVSHNRYFLNHLATGILELRFDGYSFYPGNYDDFIARDNFDTAAFYPALWEEMKWQDHIFGIPVSSASFAFFYNKKLFRKAGLDPEHPPKTWDEVVTYTKQLTRYDASGNIIQMGFYPFYKSALTASQNSPSTPLIIAWEKGASFLSSDGKRVTLINPEYIEALEWLLEFTKPYPVEKMEAFSAGFGYGDQHAFTSEKVAMMILPDIFPDYIKHHAPNLDYGVALTPTFPGCPIASSSGCWWLAIPRGCKDPEAAWEFIKYNASKEVQLDARDARDEILFPSNRYATADPRFLADQRMAIFATHLEHAHSPTIVPMAHDVFWREFYTAQEKIVYRDASIEKALSQAESLIQHELDKAISYDEYVRTKMSFTEINRE